MSINRSQAVVAGVCGGIVMTVIMALGRALGLEANLEMMLGTMLGPEPGFGAWVLGLILHLAISGAIGLIYALAFERWLHRANWQAGMALSLVHMVVGGVFLAMVPALHPHIPEVLAAPGPFMAYYGMGGVLCFVLVHLVYGGVVGGVYEMRQRQRATKTAAYDDHSKVA